VRTAAVGLWLAGLAAAGTAVTGARAPQAAPVGGMRVAAAKCEAGNGIGAADRVKYQLKVNGQSLEHAVLKMRDWVRTDPSGAGDICLRLGRTTCRVGSDSVVRVRPGKGVLLYVTRSVKRVSCETSSGKRKRVKTPQATITIDDPVFSVTVARKQTVVKVRRGAAVVARGARMRQAVVLARNRQVAVRAGRDPQEPTAISVNVAERTVFRELERSAPAFVPDTTAPTTRIVKGPPDPSASRTATFRFRAFEKSKVEDDVIFSCSLDGDPYRFCSYGPRYLLLPGRHSLLVRATDAAGNAGPATPHVWTIRRSASSPIAFESNRDGNYEIYVMSVDGSGQTRLTGNAAVDVDAAWSPDGTKLAFESDRVNGETSEIYVMDADGSDQRRLTANPAQDRNPKWSPFGTRIAFESNRDGDYEIYVMRAGAGGGRIKLTANPARDSDPAWSPDGTKIAFESERDGNDEIYVMNADGSRPIRLTADPAGDVNPAWSPDGEKIAFESDRDGNHELYVMNADGNDQTRLTANAARDSDAAWSPDGRRIAFASDRAGDLEIYVMDADGDDQTRLTNSPGEDLVPSW
jgi:Tol biopolymer transport system component